MEMEEELASARVPASSTGGVGPIFVAVGKDKEVRESRSTLVWALRNMRPFSKIVLAHVHCPAQMIPMPLGGHFRASYLSKEELRAFRLEEKMKMNETLDAYLAVCNACKVQAEILIAEADDIAAGLLDLILQKRVTRLVMGASTFSRTTKAPKSKTANTILQEANPSCHIWFISRGGLISTRDSILLRNGTITQSPASPGVMTTLSEPLPSRSSQAGLASIPFHQIFRRKSKSSVSVSSGEQTAVSKLMQSSDHQGAVSPNPQFSRASSKSGADDTVSHSGSSLTSKGEDIGNGSTEPRLVHESVGELLPSATYYQASLVVDDDLYDKLHQAIIEAANCKDEAYQESVKRRRAEKELLHATRIAGDLERSLARESNLRKELEEEYNREMFESEKLRKELDEVSRELHITCEQKLELDVNINDLKLQLSQAEKFLISLEKERDLLQQERHRLQQELNVACSEIEELQSQRMEMGSSHLRVLHLSEFSYLELLEATDNFKDALKIGEGGYGIVYKAFLRQTTVAIKKLHSQSMQGHSEFHNEVEILSQVRHPNLVTLIGACQEADALVYEFLPCGSLEDRLACKDNTPSLSWQARIRISAEICCALIFLHSARPQTVVHGDLKPANVLLDANLVSKLSDFGLSRLLTWSSTSSTVCHQTDPKGPFCYLDPIFISSRELTPFSDVYSFGIIILQLLTGRQPFRIVKDMQMALENNNLQEILDQSAGGWPFVQARQLAYLGVRCCDIDRKNRPDLLEVWRIIEPMKKASTGPLYYFGEVEENHNVPCYFLCPIFQEIMSDPYVAADGYTYEAEAIRGWLESGHATSPMTNLKLENVNLTPNYALRSVIQEWLQQRRHS